MSWIRRQYSPEEGFTKEEMRRNIHTIWIDLECSDCGKVVSLANNNGDSNPCPCQYNKEG